LNFIPGYFPESFEFCYQKLVLQVIDLPAPELLRFQFVIIPHFQIGFLASSYNKIGFLFLILIPLSSWCQYIGSLVSCKRRGFQAF
jgi:hypothetical protein